MSTDGQLRYDGGDLVVGEAVVLELRPASFITRGLALLLDLMVLLVAVLLIGWLLYATTGDVDPALGSALGLVATLAVIIGIPILVETLTRGRSLGKWAAGLRVVRDDGGPIRARHAVIRGLLGVIELYWTTGCLALITSLLNPRGKRLGDLLAGTYVIRERTPREHSAPPLMPPFLQGWAEAGDLGRLPDRLGLAVRQFLGRSAALTPADRARLGLQLAEQVQRYVAPAPPPGTHPEAFLSAVLAERRRRDQRRLEGEARAREERLARRAAASRLSPLGSVGDRPE
jgi:uncharacterized RDD family membrane protein YckC